METSRKRQKKGSQRCTEKRDAKRNRHRKSGRKKWDGGERETEKERYSERGKEKMIHREKEMHKGDRESPIKRPSQRHSRERETNRPRTETHIGRDIHLYGWSQRKKRQKETYIDISIRGRERNRDTETMRHLRKTEKQIPREIETRRTETSRNT